MNAKVDVEVIAQGVEYQLRMLHLSQESTASVRKDYSNIVPLSREVS